MYKAFIYDPFFSLLIPKKFIISWFSGLNYCTSIPGLKNIIRNIELP